MVAKLQNNRLTAITLAVFFYFYVTFLQFSGLNGGRKGYIQKQKVPPQNPPRKLEDCKGSRPKPETSPLILQVEHIDGLEGANREGTDSGINSARCKRSSIKPGAAPQGQPPRTKARCRRKSSRRRSSHELTLRYFCPYSA